MGLFPRLIESVRRIKNRMVGDRPRADHKKKRDVKIQDDANRHYTNRHYTNRYYTNRELSCLSFNDRVLSEAANPRVPLDLSFVFELRNYLKEKTELFYKNPMIKLLKV